MREVGQLKRGRHLGGRAVHVDALNGLRRQARLDVADLDECRLEREHGRALECYSEGGTRGEHIRQ